ncbi:PREDICTED: serine/threonine-protein kinase EDR1-like [Nelumbo nucifera]|uniref:Serine/threonine-protein kinase EDR1-like n=1 Tax=Nelumbo nucifera TaxID=4432 RepID=A0A1U7Z466_NELNU|nr:PREDICTED: serine/threonine-protein kinase EDR1-like [Nelumbo nucifera]
MVTGELAATKRVTLTSTCSGNLQWRMASIGRSRSNFGLSRVMMESPMRDSSSVGTPKWMAPELIHNEPFTEKCDDFSLSVISRAWNLFVFQVAKGNTGPSNIDLCAMIRVVYEVANEGSWLEIPEGPLGRLIADCWVEPNERPSCEEILLRLLDCEYTLC